MLIAGVHPLHCFVGLGNRSARDKQPVIACPEVGVHHILSFILLQLKCFDLEDSDPKVCKYQLVDNPKNGIIIIYLYFQLILTHF